MADEIQFLQEELDYTNSIVECTENFYKFFQEAWHVVEGKTPFFPNWHLEAICEHLEAAMRGEIRYLLINIPPRAGKPLGKDTLVLMWDGSRKYLKDIEIGDKILTGKGRFRAVLAKHSQGPLETLRITTFSGRKIISALSHPFLTSLGWKEAKDLRVDELLGMAVPNENFGKPIL